MARSPSFRPLVRWLAGLSVVVGIGVFGVGNAFAANDIDIAEGFSALVKKVMPTVASISTSRQVGGGTTQPDLPQFPPGSPFEEFFKEFFDQDRPNGQQRQRRASSVGSGFIIGPDGYVVTNNHVIADSDQITVTLFDDSEFEAKLVGRDPKTDLALLKIESEQPLPYVEWADSDDVEIGDWMVAIGNPFTFGFSVTAGIVSGRGRNIRAGPYDDFFQVDAAINRGNSGGPSFTLDGKVFGVNTAIFSPSGGNVGIGFAIPSNQARRVIDSIRSTGRVARGWLGVRVQSMTAEIAESLGLQEDIGALVATVTPGGPAAAAEIEEGDVILSFDGQSIDEMRTLPRLVGDAAPSDVVTVEIWRDGERSTLQVTLGELQDDVLLAETADQDSGPQRTVVEIEELGLVLATIDDELREQFGFESDVSGLVILEIVEDGAAEDQNLMPGDRVLEINQHEIGAAPELQAKVNEARSDGQKSVLLLIDRAGDRRFVGIRFSD